MADTGGPFRGAGVGTNRKGEQGAIETLVPKRVRFLRRVGGGERWGQDKRGGDVWCLWAQFERHSCHVPLGPAVVGGRGWCRPRGPYSQRHGTGARDAGGWEAMGVLRGITARPHSAYPPKPRSPVPSLPAKGQARPIAIFLVPLTPTTHPPPSSCESQQHPCVPSSLRSSPCRWPSKRQKQPKPLRNTIGRLPPGQLRG